MEWIKLWIVVSCGISLPHFDHRFIALNANHSDAWWSCT